MNHAEFVDTIDKLDIVIGCDPELFIRNKSTDKFVSAHHFIKGTKKEPHQLMGGSCQVDGLAVEIGINPAGTQNAWNRNLKLVLDQVKAMLPKDHELVATPTAWFDLDYYEKEVPQSSKELGCEPDFDAYTNGGINPRPDGNIIKDGKIMRTAGGHIHIGWGSNLDIESDEHRWNCITLAKALDRMLLPCITLLDGDKERQKMYGKPGAYRPKPYGMEYRTPSNFWVLNTDFSNWIYLAVNFIVKGTAGRYDLNFDTKVLKTHVRNYGSHGLYYSVKGLPLLGYFPVVGMRAVNEKKADEMIAVIEELKKKG